MAPGTAGMSERGTDAGRDRVAPGRPGLGRVGPARAWHHGPGLASKDVGGGTWKGSLRIFLFLAQGTPVRDGVVVLDGQQISYAGPAAGAPDTPGAATSQAAAVMPGMWDCHGHFLGSRTFDLGQLPLDPVALRAARSARDLRAALDAGITSVREVGGLGVYLARAVAEGVLDGPSIYAAGAVLSTTGGHGDLHAYPLPWMDQFPYLTGHGGELRLADGVDDCMRAVREQLRRNARVIKVCASGGVLPRSIIPCTSSSPWPSCARWWRSPAWPSVSVAAHCHGKPGIMAALEAGVRTIEHGTYLDDEACDAMRETGAILVPTRTIIEDMLAHLDVVPDYAAAKLVAIAEVHAQATNRALRARGHDRDGHRHWSDRLRPAQFLGPERK